MENDSRAKLDLPTMDRSKQAAVQEVMAEFAVRIFAYLAEEKVQYGVVSEELAYLVAFIVAGCQCKADWAEKYGEMFGKLVSRNIPLCVQAWRVSDALQKFDFGGTHPGSREVN